jgi:signal transduction histidine kinase/CheY-like chemotaxis protein
MLGLLEPQARLEASQRDGLAERGATVYRLNRPDGETVVIEVTAVQEIDFDGAPAMLFVAVDLTEREKLQQRLLFSGRMASVGTLASGVAHEINNPLAFVLANVGFVLEELQGPAPLTQAQRDECVKALSDVEEGAKRVQRIVRDLRTFSRSDEEQRGPVDLHAVLESSLAIAQNELKHRAKLVRELQPVPAVIANPTRLGQVFLNLLLNAAHAIPEGAAGTHEVRVRTRLEPRGAIVEVEDTGSGMTPEVRKRIFDPFFTTKPQGEGTGLGLAICHGIITGLGGDIEVETQPGQGSTFRVLLPPAAAPALQAAGAPAAATTSRRGKVLVIDDEQLVCNSVRRTLGAEHDVEAATRVADALARFDAGARYDVILCDVMMPELSGMELLHALEQKVPAQAKRVVFLTGGAFAPKAVAFLAAVQNVVLEKPYSPAALRALVRERVSANS